MINERLLELMFSAATLIATAGWISLIFAYRWKPLRRLLTWGVIPLLLAALYIFLLTTPHAREGGFSSLADVAKLFQNKQALLAGWIHFLVFDLFVGTWETFDAEANGVPHLLVVPALVLTFMFGPIGLALYVGIRFFFKRKALIGS